jgi:hypothetical protein|tara:strand:- start:10109 stop:10324 length:216 start_codon:yes stop_codon:yes gene_type:complete
MVLLMEKAVSHSLPALTWKVLSSMERLMGPENTNTRAGVNTWVSLRTAYVKVVACIILMMVLGTKANSINL